MSGEGGLAFAVQSEATSPGTGELILTGTFLGSSISPSPSPQTYTMPTPDEMTTGKIGKSMAESCMVALSWVKAKSRDIAAWMSLHQVVVDLHRPDLDVCAAVYLVYGTYVCTSVQ